MLSLLFSLTCMKRFYLSMVSVCHVWVAEERMDGNKCAVKWLSKGFNKGMITFSYLLLCFHICRVFLFVVVLSYFPVVFLWFALQGHQRYLHRKRKRTPKNKAALSRCHDPTSAADTTACMAMPVHTDTHRHTHTDVIDSKSVFLDVVAQSDRTLNLAVIRVVWTCWCWDIKPGLVTELTDCLSAHLWVIQASGEVQIERTSIKQSSGKLNIGWPRLLWTSVPRNHMISG